MKEGLQRGAAVDSFCTAVEFLERGLNYETTHRWKYDKKWFDLNRMDKILAALDNPQLDYNIFHIAGTKGKGTTAGALAHCLRRLGHCTGLLTSPHLVTHRERIRIDGEKIDEESFWRIVRQMQPYVEVKRRQRELGLGRAPTYFEMLTALAFKFFADRNVDWASVEVGLGGRLDSTNVVKPRCCVITTIGFEHTDKLGDTIEAIAGEKGGILKEGVPVVLGRQRYPGAIETLRRMADECHCPRWEVGRELMVTESSPVIAPARSAGAEAGWRFSLDTPGRRYGQLFTPLLGVHQVDNLAAAVGALEMAGQYAGLALQPARIAEALAEFRMPARVEVLQDSPMLVLDVAHTVESVEALLAALDTHFPQRPLRIVFACSADKNVGGMLRVLTGRCVSFIATQARLQRAMPVEEVVAAARECAVVAPGGPPVRAVRDAWEAVQTSLAEAQPGDVVCVTGSFYTAGEVRAKWSEAHAMAFD